MSFTLQAQIQNNEQIVKRQAQIFNKLLPNYEYKTLQIRHYQNLQQQGLNYFVTIEIKDSPNQVLCNQWIRIRKLFTNNLDQNLKKTNQKSTEDKQNQQNHQIQSHLGQNQERLDFKRIICGNFIHQNGIIVLEQPFELLFLSKKSKNAIKIVLDKTYNLSNLVAYFSYETNDEEKRKQPFSLIIYGFDKQACQSKLLGINMMTFDVKEVTYSLDYSPSLRQKYFNMFHDDRLYVFGGESTGKKQIQQLLWSFDLQKGYWFALQMLYKDKIQNVQTYMSTMYDSGKLILKKQNLFYLLEIYQCKLSLLEFQDQQETKVVKNRIENNQILGMFTLQKKLHFYTKKAVLNGTFVLKKPTKKQKG